MPTMIFIIIIFSKTVTMTSEVKARIQIDHLLQSAGWHVCNIDQVNLHAALGVAIREFPLNSGHGFADYLLYVNGKACGVIEAKKKKTLPSKGLKRMRNVTVVALMRH